MVCRQLGYTGVLRVTTQSYYGNLTAANFSMDDVNCRGDEVRYDRTVLPCCYSFILHTCTHGVVCGT